jgi:tryptophan synthase
MDTTGSSIAGTINTSLPSILSRVREHTTLPLAVGFGVATREHFNIVSDAGADGVVIGSRLVSIIKESPEGEIVQRVESYCRGICMKDESTRLRSPPAPQLLSPPLPASASSINAAATASILPMRFGHFGGQYVPEVLFECLVELEEAHKVAITDPEFWKEFECYYGYMNRPSKLYYAENLTKEGGGAGIWLKREDL